MNKKDNASLLRELYLIDEEVNRHPSPSALEAAALYPEHLSRVLRQDGMSGADFDRHIADCGRCRKIADPNERIKQFWGRLKRR